jgi:hypothetical protein
VLREERTVHCDVGLSPGKRGSRQQRLREDISRGEVEGLYSNKSDVLLFFRDDGDLGMLRRLRMVPEMRG